MKVSKHEYGTAMKMVVAGLIPLWNPSAEDEFFTREYPAVVTALANRARSVLTERQADVIACRFGFIGEPMSTLETADFLDISHQRVSEIEKQAIAAMRKALGVKKLSLSNRPRRKNATAEELKAIRERNALSWNVQDWKRPNGERYDE